MKTILITFLSMIFAATSFGADQVSIAISKVLDAPGPDTREMTLRSKEMEERILVDRKEQDFSNEIAEADIVNGASPAIRITLTKEGAKRFAELTEEWRGKRLAMILDGRVVSAPVVREVIPGGSFVITGNMTKEFAEKIVATVKNAKD